VAGVSALLLPYPPSTNRLWLFVGGRRPIKSQAAKDFRKIAELRAVEAGVKLLPGDLAVRVVLHPPRPANWKPGKRVRSIDLDNALKAALDALNGIAWEDDSQIQEIIAVRGEPVPCGCLVIEMRQVSDY
jgi:crossover junction endodeoxyribonuclease RusA